MYNSNLKKGDIVKIYTNYKDDTKYEGIAKLVKFDKKGDTFYEDYEELYITENTRSSLKIKLSHKQKQLNALYEFLDNYFKSINPFIRSFKDEMRKNCNKKIYSYYKMYEICQKYKDIASNNSTISLNTIFNTTDINNIIRYFQQKHLKNWRPTLFSSERWLVEFLPQYDPDNNILFNKPFLTYRYIKIIVKISPNEETKIDDLVKYTTYNGKTQLLQDDIEDDLDELDLSVDFLFDQNDENLII